MFHLSLPVLPKLTLYGSLSVVLAQAYTIHWTDLSIHEQIAYIFGLCLIIFLCIVGVKVFTNIWVKDGYAGKDKILVDKEVSLYISHVLAYSSFVVFLFMVIFRVPLHIPTYAFAIDGSMFMSAGAYAIYEKVTEKFLKKPIKE